MQHIPISNVRVGDKKRANASELGSRGPQRIIVVPGFFSPRWLMLPLRNALRHHWKRTSIWDDASVFQSLELSVKRLTAVLGEMPESRATAIVTHSFGDWIVRQVLASGPSVYVSHLISLAPIIDASLVARIAVRLGGRAIPELAVMANPRRASEHLALDPAIHREILWATLDPWLHGRKREVEDPNVSQRTVLGSHNSIVLQPNVHRMVGAALRS